MSTTADRPPACRARSRTRIPCRRAGDLAHRLDGARSPFASPPQLEYNPVVVTQLNDINARGAIVGDVYGLAAKDFGALSRIDPVLWKCPFGR